MKIPYHVVDVFTQTPLEGNALAVFPDGSSLDSATMQKIAKELNLSETTFVLPATKDGAIARVRIFTPSAEMKFAGHPTVGTSYVLRSRRHPGSAAPSFALEELIGLVNVRMEGVNDPLIWLMTPPISMGKTYDREQCAEVLGLSADDLIPNVPAQVVTAGNPNIYIALRDKVAVDGVLVDTAKLRRLFSADRAEICLFVFSPTAAGAYSRMFAPDLGVVEDPATGSATGPLAKFMMEYGLAPYADGTKLVSEQGTKMGRRSYLHTLVHGDHGSKGIEVGGHVRPVADATLIVGE